MASTSFADLIAFLQREEDSLKVVAKSDLKSTLRTGAGTKGNTFDSERLHFYKVYCQLVKTLTEQQRNEIAMWEDRLCIKQENVEFRRFVGILENRKDELRKLGKSSLEACLNTQHSKVDKDLKFCSNFFHRKKASLTSEQDQELLSLEKEICADAVALRPVVDADFRKFVKIVQKRKDELQKLGKSSLEACFSTNRSNDDKDLKSCRNFLQRKKESLSPEQEQELLSLEKEICADAVALRPVLDADFRKFVEIVQKRKDELQKLGKSSLEACFSTNRSNDDKDLKSCRNFLQRKKESLSPEQEQELLSLEKEICADAVALRPVVDADFRKFVEIVQKRKDELQKLGKSSLEACFSTNRSNDDKDLKSCRNFLQRKKESLSSEQEQELLRLEREVCVVNLDDFRRFTTLLQTRGQELAQTRLPDLHAVFSSRRKKDRDLEFCRVFWQRSASKLTPLQQQEVDEIAVAITCPVTFQDRAALRPAVGRLLCKFEAILDRRRMEFVALGACSTQSLFARHFKKTDNELRFCYDFLARVFRTLNPEQQQYVRSKLENVLVSKCQVPLKAPYQGKLHAAETMLSDALPRPRLPKSLRQFYGNSMDAEARVMTFFHRVHEVDTYMTSLEFQDCDYCHEGWFGTRKKKAELPGGFECEVFKKTNFLRAPVAQWLDPSRPICENCLLEAKKRASEGLVKEPLRFTAANYADPGVTLPETDALTFFEEEILSPIQHIVRIFTLHATGQCELRGHVGNLFQNGPQYVRNIPAAIGDMKMLLVRRCPKDPNRKQRVPFLVSRRRLERALHRICRPLEEGGSVALQPGALTPGGFVELLRPQNLQQYADSEEGEEPDGLQVQVVDQAPWERIEKKLFAMWMSTSLELQMAAKVRLLHEPEMAEDDAQRVQCLWDNLRAAMNEQCADQIGGPEDLMLTTLAGYLSLKFDEKSSSDVEKILYDELTAVQELASWEEPLVSDGLWSPEDLAGHQTEADLKDDLWESICQANDSSSNKSSIHRFGAARVTGVPILDPPTVSSKNQLIREDQPYYIVAGFVKLFPLGHGDYWAHLQQRQHETYEPLPFWEWLKHLLLRSDGRFQAHPRFYFFALNTALRNKALRARGYFLRRQQSAASNVEAYTAEDLFRMGKAQFTKIVSAFEHSMAGSAQEKLRQRSDLEAMVEQIEQESLEEQAHALLHSWQKGRILGSMLEEQGFFDATAEMHRACTAAKDVIDKVLSPETIAAAPRPTITRVATDHVMAPEGQVACVAMDRAPESQPAGSRVATDHVMAPEGQVACVAVDRAPKSRPAGSRVAMDRASESQPASSRVATDHVMAPEGQVACVAMDRAPESQPASSRVATDRALEPLQQKIDSQVVDAGYVYRSIFAQGEQTMQEVLEEMKERTLCVQGGGEIPCHFTTLTTAIYHWSDLAKCLENYETATVTRRGGRSDPLEPSEKQVSPERRRVLRFPGVVAWFTAYKMELFYKHVLRYEDGQGVFEWGSGGIMHLHSINFGSCMPRVDPAAAGMQQPDVKTADIASRFAEIHEEYLTDWSLAKAEKWTFQEVDNNAARLARPGSPLHTDSESDGSEDLEETGILDKCVRRSTPQSGIDVGLSTDVSGQHAVSDDVDFQRVFPTSDSMAYVMSNGVRATYKLSPADHDALNSLDASLKDPAWHPCRISIQEKSLLMTNNCRLVRRARRKWYRRLTEKCNMHDRHAGIPFELPPVHIEAEGTADQEVVEEVLSVLESASLSVGTLNMHMLLPGSWFAALLTTCDVLCLQEVTLQCLQEIVCLGKQQGFHVVSPLQRGVVPAEGFDVCLLLRGSKLECMRVRISPLPRPSMRFFVQAHVLFRENGSLLVVATGHLTAGPDMKDQRSHELECIFRSLEAAQNVDACIFAGDANMRRDELFPKGVSPNWRDAWMLDGSPESLSGTWCPDTVSVDDERVREWRFDRIYTYCQFGTKQVGTKQVDGQVACVAMDDAADKPQPATSRVATDRDVAPKHVPVHKSFATVQLVRNTFNVLWPCEDLDHAFVHANLDIMPLTAGNRTVSAEEVKILRPGLGSKVARRPNERESCSQKQHSHVYCGKDYEKPRLLPGMGSILEDSRRKSLFRLYTRRNCHHLNTHDPLKAMGLVANVDDQVVLTVQAAVNYLTKYLGKLGGGHSAQSRISALIDDIVCRMSDRESMTVASLLSKLFIHSAVPEEICSLEAWHLLMDLPRVLSSRHVTSLNVKDDSKTFKDLNSIEKAKTEESVIQQNKVQIYLDRFNMKVADALTEASLANMSLFQFVSRVDRRGKSLHLRAKSNIVKEKPFLRLDARRREAGGMARMCLRLHGPFKTESEDPIKLEDAVAVERLHDFVQCATCPVWLKKRYAKHNRVKRANTVQEIDVQTQNRAVALWPARGSEDPAIVSEAPPAEEQPNTIGVALRPVSEAETEGADLSFPLTNPIPGGKVINLSGPRDAVPEFDNMETEKQVAANKFIADTPANREMVAHQHGLLWCSIASDSRYSIVDAIRHQRPALKLVCAKAYLEALTESKPQGSRKAQSFIEQFVFLMLFIDLQRYERRGAGVVKPGLNKKALVNLTNAYFQSQGSSTTAKEKKSVTSKSFAELWEYVKSATLQQCGLAVSSSPRYRVGFHGDAVDTNTELKAGTWRQLVFCLDPFRLEHEEWEDPAEREAKRLRYVQSAMHEQSMGRPGKKLHEVTLPVDLDALTCADFDTRAEWDALNPYVHLVSSEFLSANLAESILPETRQFVLKPSQGGMAHNDAKQLAANAEGWHHAAQLARP